MNTLWSYFWPVISAGLVIGAIAGAIGFRLPRVRSSLAGDKAIIARWRRKRAISLVAGFLLTIGAAALWHGPLGGADRFTGRVEQRIRQTLVYYEMTKVQAQLHHRPLTREITLSGPADDFQRRELARFMNDISGVRDASWSASGGGLPLIVEGMASAVAGFLLGLLAAHLVELRRRYNAQWNW